MRDLGPFEDRPGIAVGVSGGPDSMALALLLQAWTAERRGHVLALVVDHRLRPESTAEAAGVAARLEALGIRARVLTREGPPPRAALQATARAARYALLEEATAAAGLLHLAIAHHRQDQLETQALRRAAGSGPSGLAGMAGVRELDRVRLIRPLLDVPPERLKALLVARGVTWLEDPSNRDQRFWRARHRAAAIPPAGPEPAIAAARRRAVEQAVAARLAAHARPHPLGFVVIEAETLLATAGDLLPPLLAGLVTTVSGGVWPPGEAALARLLDWLRRGTGRRRALGGVLVERCPMGMLRFVREPRAVAGPEMVPETGLFWDGRFRIERRGVAGAITVRAAGQGWRRRLAAILEDRSVPDFRRVPAVVLETLPLVAIGDAPAAIGPWRLGTGSAGLSVGFRPRRPCAIVPFGQTPPASVASPGECLMYGSGRGEARGAGHGGSSPEAARQMQDRCRKAQPAKVRAARQDRRLPLER